MSTHYVDTAIWEFFEKCGGTKKRANCNSCCRTLSYETDFTNLRTHLRTKHKLEYRKFIKMRSRLELQVKKNSALAELEHKEVPSDTLIWKSFEKSNDESPTAVCNFCGTSLAYGSAIDDLRRHLMFQHVTEYDKIVNSTDQPEPAAASENSTYDDDDEQDDATVVNNGNDNEKNGNACPIKFENEDVEDGYIGPSTPDENKGINVRNNDLHIWNFFEKSIDDEGIAACNDCGDELVCKISIANLEEHLRVRHISEYNNYIIFTKQLDPPTKVHKNPKPDDENTKQLEIQSSSDEPIWKYFENTDRNRTALCNKCRRTLSYKTSITNLEKHLKAKHKSDFINYTKLIKNLENTIPEDSASEIEETENLCNSPLVSETKKSGSVNLVNPSAKTASNEITALINGVLWNFFEKSKYGKKVAKCNYCSKKISYKTSVTNLKAHLRSKHGAEYDIFVSLSKALDSAADENEKPITTAEEHIEMRPKYSRIWKCFERTDPVKRIATCNVCSTKLSYRSTTFNLKKHLRSLHNEKYKKIFNVKEPRSTRKRRRSPSMSDRSTTSESEIYNAGGSDTDDDVPDHAQETEAEDVWHYFEKIPSNRARCILCKETFNRNLSFLTKHMTDKHRKVALDLPSDSDDDRNCYTEVVYLEEEQPASVETKPKLTKKTPEAKRLKLSPKYEYLNQLKKSERPSKNKEVDDEIENFGRYVIGLLKKMPKDISTQLQMDIISMIMTAKLKLETSTTESVNVSMSNVHDGVVLTPSNVIVTTPSNVIHTTQNNESLPTLVIGVENES